MWRFALKEGGKWVLALFGALLIAAALSALADPGPYLAAFGNRLMAFLSLDPGRSTISGLPAARELAMHGPATADVVLLGALMALMLGLPLGLLLGTGGMRRATAPVIQIVSAAPVFCACLALAYAAFHLFGIRPDTASRVTTLFLPTVAVGLAGTAAVQMALRRAASLAQDSPFRLGLRRLGLTAMEIERVYVAPQIFAGLLESLGEVMLTLLSAAVVAEWVFQSHGIAELFVKSVALHDWSMAAPILLVFAALTCTAEFLGRVGSRVLMRAAS
ncbi:MAG: ABC transporter permease subunit [Alphaproteobacteria bacterium]|nr:ABC transporter permease subunit [Alphaproteobacteria bacterium]